MYVSYIHIYVYLDLLPYVSFTYEILIFFFFGIFLLVHSHLVESIQGSLADIYMVCFSNRNFGQFLYKYFSVYTSKFFAFVLFFAAVRNSLAVCNSLSLKILNMVKNVKHNNSITRLVGRVTKYYVLQCNNCGSLSSFINIIIQR